MKNVATLLRAAKAKIKSKEHWMKSCLACTEDGIETKPKSVHAHSFCALGALLAVSDDRNQTKRARRVLRDVLPDSYCSIIEFNDNHRTTHRRVLGLYDRAIKLAKEKGK